TGFPVSVNAAGGEFPVSVVSNQIGLIDPRGRVTGCSGEILPDYTGFNVGLYEPDPADPSLSAPRSPVRLVPTQWPGVAGSGIPEGIAPNEKNSNPFFLSRSDPGAYTFLLDPGQGQTAPDRVYLLVVNPPVGSGYVQRRIRIVLRGRSGEFV